MSNKYKDKGITLIVLVITIIVLIILAAVTINASMGNNSSIERAKDASDNYNNAAKKEQDQIDDAKSTKLNIDNLINNSGNTEYPVYNEGD